MKKRWTEERIALLRELYGRMTASQLAEKLQTTENAIYDKCSRMSISKVNPCWKRKLSERQLLWLRLNFPDVSNGICAMLLGINPRTVARIARSMKLKKSRQFMQENQLHASQKAKESHIRNGTYPKKGFCKGNLRKGRAHAKEEGSLN